ncbi:hypothetical protein [Arthrobacter sp. 35W]|uniref:hypothetical protein n=1 Tax=Arthrobacter sp. 35W TaxID=1132441 RepID=UPI00047A02D9|nr:hypothetical protein [Arthrobacter sp. 35W]
MVSQSHLGTSVLSSDVFKYWVIDRSRRQIRILCQDGRELTEEIALDDPILRSEIDLSIVDWENWWVTSQTKQGHLIVAEAYSPLTVDPLHGRPSVYLDQNHWSTLAQAMFDPSSIKKATERAAAMDLIVLAQDGGIVLPLSSANVRETANLYGAQRYKVGASIASLSKGWQLRHPLAVWRAEFVRVLAERHSLPTPTTATLAVVTLEPHALLDDDVQAYAMAPDDIQLFSLAMSTPGVILELLVHPEKSERSDPHSWVTSNEKFAAQLAASPNTKHEKEQAAYARAWAENRSLVEAALTELGMGPKGICQITDKEIPQLFGRMPALGYFTRLMVMRQVNASHKWRPNDLTDLIFLSCAAGYTDYLAAEKHTGTQLKQMLPNGASVHTTLESLVQKIREDGVRTAGEKEASA